MSNFRQPLAFCPQCQEKIDGATAVNGRDIDPNPGDLSICFYCGSLLRYREGLRLRVLDDEEFKDLPYKNRLELRKAQSAILSYRAKRAVENAKWRWD